MASFSGPYSQLVGIRLSAWLRYYKKSMMTSARARDADEDLEDVEVSPRDLVKGGGGKV